MNRALLRRRRRRSARFIRIVLLSQCHRLRSELALRGTPLTVDPPMQRWAWPLPAPGDPNINPGKKSNGPSTDDGVAPQKPESHSRVDRWA